MSVKIRLKRTGRHKDASYRIVVADSRFPRDGRFIEEIGTYQPLKNSTVVINKESAKKWIKEGAQPTDTVKNILDKQGIYKELREEKKAGK